MVNKRKRFLTVTAALALLLGGLCVGCELIDNLMDMGNDKDKKEEESKDGGTTSGGGTPSGGNPQSGGTPSGGSPSDGGTPSGGNPPSGENPQGGSPSGGDNSADNEAGTAGGIEDSPGFPGLDTQAISGVWIGESENRKAVLTISGTALTLEISGLDRKSATIHYGGSGGNNRWYITNDSTGKYGHLTLSGAALQLEFYDTDGYPITFLRQSGGSGTPGDDETKKEGHDGDKDSPVSLGDL